MVDKKKANVITILFLLNCAWLGVVALIKFYPTTPDATLILVNQVGYYPMDDGKRVLVQIDRRPSGFENTMPYKIYPVLVNDSVNETAVVMEGSLQYLGTLWQHQYYEANISALRTEGRYRVKVTCDQVYLSHPFNISVHILDATVELGYNFFYYQRCGCAIESIVKGYPAHGPCHMDDANWDGNQDNVATYRNLSGGWHDAGDYNKYNGFTLLAVYSLIQAYENNPQFFSSAQRMKSYPTSTGALYHTDTVPDVVEEAIWGADFLVKCTYENGSMINSVGSNDFHGWYGWTGRPEKETDNDPATPLDNRKYLNNAWYPLIGVTGLLKLSRILTANQWFLDRASLYYSTALKIINYHVQADQVNPDLLLANLELYKITNNGSYLNESNRIAEALLNNTNYVKSPGFAHCGVDDYMRALGEWVQVNGSLDAKFNVSQAFETHWQYFWEPMFDSSDATNFFHILKANTTEQQYYFYPWVNGWNVGQNSYYLSAAAAALWGYNVTTQIKYLNFALRQLDWILGMNPFGVCMVEGAGSFNPTAYHNRYDVMPGDFRGAIPGTVPNGIIRTQPVNKTAGPDEPWFDMRIPILERGSADYASNEPWLPHNCYYLLTTSKLQALI